MNGGLPARARIGVRPQSTLNGHSTSVLGMALAAPEQTSPRHPEWQRRVWQAVLSGTRRRRGHATSRRSGISINIFKIRRFAWDLTPYGLDHFQIGGHDLAFGFRSQVHRDDI